MCPSLSHGLSLSLSWCHQLWSLEMPQFRVSLTDDSRLIIYDRNMFKIQSTEVCFILTLSFNSNRLVRVPHFLEKTTAKTKDRIHLKPLSADSEHKNKFLRKVLAEIIHESLGLRLYGSMPFCQQTHKVLFWKGKKERACLVGRTVGA